MTAVFIKVNKNSPVHAGEKKMRILLLGGLGVVGSVLAPALPKKYEVLVSDIADSPPGLPHEYLQIDVSDFHHLVDRIPRDIDALINLTAMPEQEALVGHGAFHSMTDVYTIGSYNVFLAAARLGIHKVIFASSNHASGDYEQNGHSLLEREIKVSDCPLPDSVYGAMKLSAEHFGRLFSKQFGMSVICLRLSTLVSNERDYLLVNDRARRTILSSADAVDIFVKAIEANVRYGIYYAVSDNPGKPWSIQEAIDELGYAPSVNSEKILQGGGLSPCR